MRPMLALLGLLVVAPLSTPTPADEDTRTVLTGVVTKVIDADTIDVELTSGPIRIRLHGIDAPERGQPWENESTAALTKRILGEEVDIEPFQQDRYDRLIGIIFLGDIDINAELVQQGHAWAYRRYMRKSDAALCADEAQARLAKRGLWSLPRTNASPPGNGASARPSRPSPTTRPRPRNTASPASARSSTPAPICLTVTACTPGLIFGMYSGTLRKR